MDRAEISAPPPPKWWVEVFGKDGAAKAAGNLYGVAFGLDVDGYVAEHEIGA